MLMFLLLGTLYYFQESHRLTKELEITSTIKYIDCMKLEMGGCSQEQDIEPNYDELYKKIALALALVLVLFIPISLFLSFYALKPVRQASSMIDNFIANIVHDINTPISTIMLNTKSLIKKSLEPSKKLNRILSSSKQLSDMQHDLLALADEKDEIVFEELRLKPIIEEIVEGFQLQYSTQTFELVLEEQTFSLNAVDFRRIVQNLISNAVKYNKNDNPIKIHSKNTELIIKDQGKGMAYPEKVFDKNYREDYTIQGNGLGLASVLSMIKRNNINISVKSELTKGTQILLNFR